MTGDELKAIAMRHSKQGHVGWDFDWSAIADELNERTEPQINDGDRQLCYYCKEPCNALAGNPEKWPIPLCHRDDPGQVKWHHIGCVTERLEPAEPAPTRKEAIDVIVEIISGRGIPHINTANKLFDALAAKGALRK